ASEVQESLCDGAVGAPEAPEASKGQPIPRPDARIVATLLAPSSSVAGVIALLGVVLCIAQSGRELRPVVALGLAFWLLGAALVAGGGALTRNVDWLGFFRITPRYRMLATFGLAILVAAGIAAARRVAGRWWARVLVAMSALALVAGPGRRLLPELEEVRAFSVDRDAYEAIGQIARGQGGGAAIELPFTGARLRDD